MKKLFLLPLMMLSFASCSNAAKEMDFAFVKKADKQYNVTFKNDGGTILSSESYSFGATPTEPKTPTKENPDSGYTYEFTGWSPTVSIVSSDATYVATYKAVSKACKVTWIDGDGKTLLTENYSYGSVPSYHGAIPTKKATFTKTYVFKGWDSKLEPVSMPTKTYTALFDEVSIDTRYTIAINCTDCLVNKKQIITELHAPNTSLTYQFDRIGDATHHYPYSLDVKVNGVTSEDYVYNNKDGSLDITLKGNTVINAIGDDACVMMTYAYNSIHPNVSFHMDQNFSHVDWGDGTTEDLTNKSHTYAESSSGTKYNIRIYGTPTKFWISNSSSMVQDGRLHISEITIFHSVTSISSLAFSYCSGLKSIILPKSIKSIGQRSFYFCSSLSSIVMPSSLTSIDMQAFYNCVSLKLVDLTRLDHVSSGGEDMFYGHNIEFSIFVKSILYEEYKNAVYWNSYSNDINYK